MVLGEMTIVKPPLPVRSVGPIRGRIHVDQGDRSAFALIRRSVGPAIDTEGRPPMELMRRARVDLQDIVRAAREQGVSGLGRIR